MSCGLGDVNLHLSTPSRPSQRGRWHFEDMRLWLYGITLPCHIFTMEYFCPSVQPMMAVHDKSCLHKHTACHGHGRVYLYYTSVGYEHPYMTLCTGLLMDPSCISRGNKGSPQSHLCSEKDRGIVL